MSILEMSEMKDITYIKAIQEALIEEMQRDENVFIFGEDIGVYGGCFGITRGMIEKFGKKRIVDTPMSEAGLTGIAIGAAATGLRPVLEIMFIDFITLCMDQIINHASKMRYIYGGNIKVPFVIRTVAGGGRRYGATHSQSLEAMFMNIPGLKIATPSNPCDAKGLLKTAIRDDNPVLFIENKLLYWTRGDVPKEEYTIPFGVADIKQNGRDITVVAYSRMVPIVLSASKKLIKEGIKLEIVDLRTLSPLDTKTIISSVKKTGRLITVEEGCLCGGVGAEIVARVAETGLHVPVFRIGGADVPIPYSPILEDVALPDEDDIIKGVYKILTRKNQYLNKLT